MSYRTIKRILPSLLSVVVVAACAKPDATQNAKAPGSTPVYAYEMDESTITGPPCQHQDSPYSNYICGDTLLSLLFRPMDVAAETLVVHTTDSRTIRLAIPKHTDGIFLSKSALETFLLRHYDATDTAKATSLRAYIAAHYH